MDAHSSEDVETHAEITKLTSVGIARNEDLAAWHGWSASVRARANATREAIEILIDQNIAREANSTSVGIGKEAEASRRHRVINTGISYELVAVDA